MPKIWVFQHVPYEGLGTFEQVFQELGVELRRIFSWKEDLRSLQVSEASDCDGIIVMGGPMSANDGRELPFIREELRIIEETLKAQRPFLGVCLGSQLLAKALGMRVHRGEKKEIGWYPLWMRPEAKGDPLLGGFPQRLEMFQWHGETFELAAGSVLLASSELFLHQAFRYGAKAYGLQFHAEMTAEMISDWYREGKGEISSSGLEANWQDIAGLNAKHLGALNRYAEATARGFVSLL